MSAVIDRVFRKSVTLHRDTVDYGRRILANGGTISRRDLAAIDRLLVRPAYRNGWRQFVADCSPFAGDNLAAALVKLWHPTGVQSSLTNVNFVAGDYTRSGGLNPGATNTTKYCDTGFNPSVRGITTSSGHLSIYSRTEGNSTAVEIGSYTAGSEDIWQLYLRFGETFDYQQFSYTTARANSSNSNATGFFLGSRTSTADIRAFRNGVQTAISTTAVAGSAPNSNVFVFARSNNGSPQNYSSRILTFYSLGNGIPTAFQSAMYQDILNLQTYLGRAV